MRLWIDKQNLEKLMKTKFQFPVLVSIMEPSEKGRVFLEFFSYDEEVRLSEIKSQGEIIRLKKIIQEKDEKIKRCNELMKKFLEKYGLLKKKGS